MADNADAFATGSLTGFSASTTPTVTYGTTSLSNSVTGTGTVYMASPVYVSSSTHSLGFGVNGSTAAYIDPYQQQIDELRSVLTRLDEESKMRKKYPALEHVYEQYEVMLEICKSKEADDAAGANSK